jgi:hypothetical protein
MYEYIFVYLVLPLIIIIKLIDFFVGNIFSKIKYIIIILIIYNYIIIII